MIVVLGTSGPDSMHSPQQVSKALKGRRGGSPAQPEKAGESMAGSSPANSLKIAMFGFADILALLSWKTIGESGCSTAGAKICGSRRRGKLRYTTLQSSAPPGKDACAGVFWARRAGAAG